MITLEKLAEIAASLWTNKKDAVDIFYSHLFL